MLALIEEAMKKAAVAWITVAGQGAYPIWCLWSDGALYLVTGDGEQPAPGLERAAAEHADVTVTARGDHDVLVTARGDHGGAIVTWPARVESLPPESEPWRAIAPQLAAKRLNSAPPSELVTRWAGDCRIIRLCPAG